MVISQFFNRFKLLCLVMVLILLLGHFVSAGVSAYASETNDEELARLKKATGESIFLMKKLGDFL